MLDQPTLFAAPTRTGFRTGEHLLYYNRWTGWESAELDVLLEGISLTEMRRQLTNGPVLVWMHVDPIHRHGKVYGYRFTQVTDIRRVRRRGRTEYVVSFGGGFTTLEANRFKGKFKRPKDQDELIRFVTKHPGAMRVD